MTKPEDLLALDAKIPDHLRPSTKLMAIGILNSNIKEIIELQTMLAQQGVCMTLSTAEIMVEHPSLGENTQPRS